MITSITINCSVIFICILMLPLWLICVVFLTLLDICIIRVLEAFEAHKVPRQCSHDITSQYYRNLWR